MNNLESLLKQLQERPETVDFNEVVEVIDNFYLYTPVRFSNGPINAELDNPELGNAAQGNTEPGDAEQRACVINNAGENEGSCKIFSFAQLHHLDEIQTLHCFGQYYRDDVVNHPENNDHANIRNFIKYGWSYLCFDNVALSQRQ